MKDHPAQSVDAYPSKTKEWLGTIESVLNNSGVERISS